MTGSFWWDLLIGVVAALLLAWLALAAALLVARPRGSLLTEALRILPDVLRLVRRLAADTSLPRGVRIRLGLLLAYLALPIDLIPDVVPVLGYADDAVIVAVVLRGVARRAGVDAVRAHWPGTDDGFAAVVRLTGLTDGVAVASGSASQQAVRTDHRSERRGVMTYSTHSTRTRAPFQWLALVIGAIYLLVGIAGFFVTGFDGFAEHDSDQTLLGFAINPLHNIVHLLIGLLGVTMWAAPAGARAFGWVLFVGYGAAFVYGLFATNDPEINFLNINVADNWLHIVSALAGLVIALWPYRPIAPTTAGPEQP